MKIIHGTPRDFHRNWRDAPWAEPQFAAYIEAGKAEFWYARIGLRVVGRIYLFWELPDAGAADGVRRGYLCNLHVPERYRGRGIGSALLEAAARRARELGFAELTLGVEPGNTSNVRLYERMGFVNTLKSCESDLVCVEKDGTPLPCNAYQLRMKTL